MVVCHLITNTHEAKVIPSLDALIFHCKRAKLPAMGGNQQAQELRLTGIQFSNNRRNLVRLCAKLTGAIVTSTRKCVQQDVNVRTVKIQRPLMHTQTLSQNRILIVKKNNYVKPHNTVDDGSATNTEYT